MIPSPLDLVALFLLFTSLSGLITGMKTILGFLQRQNSAHSVETDPRNKALVEEAALIWQRPGFFESLSLGRFATEGIGLICGFYAFKQLFPLASLPTACAWVIGLAFVVSHWVFPVLAQAFAVRLSGPAMRAYRVYSFLLMGRLGEWLYRINEASLRRMGVDLKLSFLGETNLEKLSPPDEDSPDRSGLGEDEKEMIRSIFDLRETQVKEIMTPRVDVVALNADAGYREVLELITNEKFSRIPVYKDNIDSIQGILHVMDLMGLKEDEKKADFRLADYVREAYFVPRTKKIGELLREFRQKHIHLAIVVDEYGGTAGIITLEDILEEIVGEIHDEDETEDPLIRKVEDGVYVIDPVIPLSELNDELELNLVPEDDDIHIDTLGGFILFVHGKVPAPGDSVRYKDITFEIMEMNGQKMEKIRLTQNAMANSQG